MIIFWTDYPGLTAVHSRQCNRFSSGCCVINWRSLIKWSESVVLQTSPFNQVSWTWFSRRRPFSIQIRFTTIVMLLMNNRNWEVSIQCPMNQNNFSSIGSIRRQNSSVIFHRTWEIWDWGFVMIDQWTVSLKWRLSLWIWGKSLRSSFHQISFEFEIEIESYLSIRPWIINVVTEQQKSHLEMTK
jgi:hypothetical protein